ncbi:MAG: acyltransferase family protein [Actinomycetota bacterium]
MTTATPPAKLGKSSGSSRRGRRPADPEVNSVQPAGKQMLPAIDGFRGLATLAVVVTHVWLLSGSARLDGGLARMMVAGGVVDFFFVISGFVLFLPAVYGKGSYGDVRAFAMRRAARILPLYYVSLIVVLALHRWIVDPVEPIQLPFESIQSTISLFMHLTFLQNFVLPLGQDIGFGNGVVWTLPLEAVFYVLLPLIALRYYRRPFLWLLLAVAVAGAYKFSIAHAAAWLPWVGVDVSEDTRIRIQVSLMHAPSFFSQFALGMTAAWVYVRINERNLSHRARRYAPITMLAALAGVVAGTMEQGADRIAGQPEQLYLHTTGLAFWFTLLMLATLFAPARLQWPATNSLARWIGTVSFGIYLFHLVLIRLAVHTLGFATDGSTGAFLTMLLFVLAGSSLVATAAYYAVEQPMRRWVRNKLRSGTASETTTAESASVPP